MIQKISSLIFLFQMANHSEGFIISSFLNKSQNVYRTKMKPSNAFRMKSPLFQINAGGDSLVLFRSKGLSRSETIDPCLLTSKITIHHPSTKAWWIEPINRRVCLCLVSLARIRRNNYHHNHSALIQTLSFRRKQTILISPDNTLRFDIERPKVFTHSHATRQFLKENAQILKPSLSKQWVG